MAEAKQTLLKVSSLKVAYGGIQAVKGVNFEVREGELVSLIGANGAGKTTTLKAVTGIQPIAAGDVTYLGESIKGKGAWDLAKKGLVMVPEGRGTFTRMTITENLQMGAYNRNDGEIQSDMDKVFALFPRLKERAKQLAGTMSGGEQQMLAMGRALMARPKVLLLDEPLSNLDAKLRTDLRRELKTLHGRLGNTMIYVTHDQVEAMTLATRIVVMHQGVIQQVGTPAEVYDRPKNLRVAGFVGSPAINRIDGRVGEAGQFVSPALALPLPAALASRQPGEALTLAVRPEHLRLGADQPFAAEIQLVEPLGNQHVVWLGSAGATLSAVLPGQPAVAEGAALRFGFDAAKALWFDAAGERIEASAQFSL